MSARRSPGRRPPPMMRRPAAIARSTSDTRLADAAPAPGRLEPCCWTPVVVALAGVLALLAWLMSSDLHLLAGARLGVLIGPSPVPGLSPAQLGKLAALAGVAALCGGAVLLATHWSRGADDRRLAVVSLALLGTCGTAAMLLELAPALWPHLVARGVAGPAEAAVEGTVLAGFALLLARRMLRPRSAASPDGVHDLPLPCRRGAVGAVG